MFLSHSRVLHSLSILLLHFLGASSLSILSYQIHHPDETYLEKQHNILDYIAALSAPETTVSVTIDCMDDESNPQTLTFDSQDGGLSQVFSKIRNFRWTEVLKKLESNDKTENPTTVDFAAAPRVEVSADTPHRAKTKVVFLPQSPSSVTPAVSHRRPRNNRTRPKRPHRQALT